MNINNITLLPKSVVCTIAEHVDNKSLSVFLRTCKKLNNYRYDSMIQQVFCRHEGYLKPHETQATWNDTYNKLKQEYTPLVRDSLKFHEISFLPLDKDLDRDLNSDSNLDLRILYQGIKWEPVYIINDPNRTSPMYNQTLHLIYENKNFEYCSAICEPLFKIVKGRHHSENKSFSIEKINEDIGPTRNFCLLNKGRHALSLNFSINESRKKFYILLLDLEEDRLIKTFTINKCLTTLSVYILSNQKEIFMCYQDKIYLKAIFSKNPDCELFTDNPFPLTEDNPF